MVTKQYRSLGFDINLEVPETVDEFNKNAWKAETGEGNPCLTEATANVIYRGSLAEFRDTFLHGKPEEKDDKGNVISAAIKGVEETTGISRNTEEVKGKDGKVRMKDGEPVTAYTESQDKYFDRVLATLVKENKFASEETARESFKTLADEVAKSIKFDAAARERAAAGPKKLPAKYKLTAARLIANGKLDVTNSQYLVKIGKSFAPAPAVPGETPKLFTGTYEVKDPTTGAMVQKTVEVSDKDAETLGWLLKEFNDWQSSQTLEGM